MHTVTIEASNRNEARALVLLIIVAYHDQSSFLAYRIGYSLSMGVFLLNTRI